MLRRLSSPSALVAAGVLLAASAYWLHQSPDNPPGFHRDEASVALNAYTISRDLRDQDGGLLPLYITSFGDYKSPLFVYLLAGAFRVFPPHASVARHLGAVVVLAAILVVALLAYRRTRSIFVALAVFVLGVLTPWLYELGRVAYETVLEPLVIALVLLALEWAYRSPRPLVFRALLPGLALGALTYVYAAGRLLAPLYVLALLVFAGRGRWRFPLATAGVFLLTQIPLAVYWFRHPGALTARYQSTTFIQDGMSPFHVLGKATWNYVQDVSLWHWIVSGDPKPYIHTWGAGQLFASVVLLAALGVVCLWRREREDRWWRFVVVALFLSPIPAALTVDRHDALRLLPIPLLLLLLAAPGLAFLMRLAQERWAPRTVLAVLTIGVAAQFVWFVDVFDSRGSTRALVYEADVPGLLAQGFANDQTIYIDHDDRYAQTHALWYAVSHGIPTSRVSILHDGWPAPNGAIAFGRFQECDYPCARFAEADTYWLARSEQPAG